MYAYDHEKVASFWRSLFFSPVLHGIWKRSAALLLLEVCAHCIVGMHWKGRVWLGLKVFVAHDTFLRFSWKGRLVRSWGGQVKSSFSVLMLAGTINTAVVFRYLFVVSR